MMKTKLLLLSLTAAPLLQAAAPNYSVLLEKTKEQEKKCTAFYNELEHEVGKIQNAPEQPVFASKEATLKAITAMEKAPQPLPEVRELVNEVSKKKELSEADISQLHGLHGCCTMRKFRNLKSVIYSAKKYELDEADKKRAQALIKRDVATAVEPGGPVIDLMITMALAQMGAEEIQVYDKETLGALMSLRKEAEASIEKFRATDENDKKAVAKAQLAELKISDELRAKLRRIVQSI